MNRFLMCVCLVLSAVNSAVVLAFECANAGALPSLAPNDNNVGDVTACGAGADAGGYLSLAIGTYANASGYTGNAVGNYSSASATEATAVGTYTSAYEYRSTALGSSAQAAGQNSLALGFYSQALATNAISIGADAVANQPNTMVLGSIPGVELGTAYVNVGMGTMTPTEAVDVARSGAAARFQLTSYTNESVQAPQYIQRRARGTSAAPTAVQNNDNLGLFSFRGYNGSVMGGSRATITAQAAGNFSTTSTPTRLIFATTPVGQTTPVPVLTITPDGKVQVKGTNLNVPDYVFEDDYPLMPLSELRSFIDENGHLPGIAPAHEVNAEGLDLAGSQMGLLRKVEELTLYTLQQQATIDDQHVVNGELQRRNGELEARTRELETRLARLESALERSVASGR